MRRGTLVWSLIGVGFVAVGAAALAIAIPLIHDRTTFGTFDKSGLPPRIAWCGRRYVGPQPGTTPPTVTQAEAKGFETVGQWQRIGTTPAGDPYFAAVMSASDKHRFFTDVCAMGVWVNVGPDQYVSYSLSGGP